jgi:hypothetical protein
MTIKLNWCNRGSTSRSVGTNVKSDAWKNKNRLAFVKNAELNKITIPPNTVMDIQGYSDKETQYRNTSAIHHASDLTFVPTDLDVEPRLRCVFQ